jgi:hypothetical protein
MGDWIAFISFWVVFTVGLIVSICGILSFLIKILNKFTDWERR